MDNLAKDERFSNNPFALKLEALTVEEFVAADLPERKLLMGPWLPVGGAAMIFGPAGVGKTQLALSIAMAVATGSSLLGWPVPEPRKALFIDGEMNPSDIQHRLAARYEAKGLDPDGRLLILSALLQSRDQEFLNLAKAEHQQYLDPLLAEADLVVVDNLSSLMSADGTTENDAESWNAVHTWMMTLRARQKAVLFVHHAGKSGDQRGTSRRIDALDTVLKLTDMAGNEGCELKVEFVKKRGFYGRDAEPFIARMSTLPSRKITWSRSPLDLAQEFRDLKQQGWTLQRIADRHGVNKSTVFRSLKQ